MKRMVILSLLVVVFTPPACAADSGGGSRRKLESVETIQGIPCISHTHLYEGGSLRACMLPEEAEIFGHRFPQGSRVFLDTEGRLDFCFLAHDTKVEGHLCRGSGHGYMTSFHPNGRLRVCWLKQAETIEGVPCRRATFLADVMGETVGVYFYDNGQLEGCEIDHAVKIDGQDYRRGDRFHRPPSPVGSTSKW